MPFLTLVLSVDRIHSMYDNVVVVVGAAAVSGVFVYRCTS